MVLRDVSVEAGGVSWRSGMGIWADSMECCATSGGDGDMHWWYRPVLWDGGVEC